MPRLTPPDPKARLLAELQKRAAETLRRELRSHRGWTVDHTLESRRIAERMQKEAAQVRRRHAVRKESSGISRGKVCVAPSVRPAWPRERLELFLGTF